MRPPDSALPLTTVVVQTLAAPEPLWPQTRGCAAPPPCCGATLVRVMLPARVSPAVSAVMSGAAAAEGHAGRLPGGSGNRSRRDRKRAAQRVARGNAHLESRLLRGASTCAPDRNDQRGDVVLAGRRAHVRAQANDHRRAVVGRPCSHGWLPRLRTAGSGRSPKRPPPPPVWRSRCWSGRQGRQARGHRGSGDPPTVGMKLRVPPSWLPGVIVVVRDELVPLPAVAHVIFVAA